MRKIMSALAAGTLVLALSAPVSASEVPQTEAEIEFVEWYTASPDNVAYYNWAVFMRDPANAAWFKWYTTPKPVYTSSYSYGVWDRLAQCEAGGNWHINTGNGYYGGLQFSLSSWRAVGGTGYPHQHSRDEQIKRGIMLQKTAPYWGHWPACSSKLGLR